MVKKIYLAGSLRNPDIPLIGASLRTNTGLDVFDDWHAPGPEADDHWRRYSEARGHTYREALRGRAARQVYGFDREHIDSSDAGVLVLPAGRSCHLEIGYMAGCGKPTFILMDQPDRWDVMYLFATKVCFSYEELVGVLNGWKKL
jgi:nucleoside 2-deoxyribosyltransferase